MILLTSTSDLVQLVTSAAQNIDVQASYVDNASGTITPGRTNTTIGTATTTTVVGSPGASTQRAVKSLHIFNRGAALNTVTVKHTDGTTLVQLIQATLAVDESLVYTDDSGWTYYASTGAPQVVQPLGNSSAGTSASPTGNVSTTEKAMGLGLVSGFSYTPIRSGNLIVMIAGMVFNSTAAGDGVTIRGRFGTGTAPANAATTGLGTQFSIDQRFVASTTAGKQGFCVLGKITGQALNTALWFDLSLIAVTGGGASVQDAQIVIIEVP